ncbi:glycosyl hydrolase-related protein [candidate division KSB1 bacterium]
MSILDCRRCSLIVFLVVIISGLINSNAQYKDEFEMQDNIHKITRLFLQWAESTGWLNGYSEKIEGTDFDYHSCVPSVKQSLISRATNGKMKAVWESETVPEDYKNDFVTFVWIAGLGVNLGDKKFDLFINDKYNLSFRTANEFKWTVTGNSGTELQFEAVQVDAAEDLFGFMFLKIPLNIVKPGEPVKICVTGEEAGSSAWFMVFKHAKIIEDIRRLAKRGFWYRMFWKNNGFELNIEAPLTWSGKSIHIKDSGELELESVLKTVGDSCKSVFTVKKNFQEKIKFPLEIMFDGKVIDRLEKLSGEWTENEIYDNGYTVFHQKTIQNKNHILQSSKSDFINISENIKSLTESYFKEGNIHIITSSHQDIAWMDSPENCILDRDRIVITPALELLRKNPDFFYSVEQTLMLKEYLQRHPERKSEIQKYTSEGRLEWGATYNQPYEGMYSGESLIRQLYFGRKWLKKTLPGCDTRTAWNIDVPGRTLQMPQILKKSGVDYLMISRHEKGLFYWQSPDGTRIGVFSPGHYHHASQFLRESTFGAVSEAPKMIKEWEPFYRSSGIPPEIPVIFSSDMSSPKDFFQLLNTWNNFRIRSAGSEKRISFKLPEFKYNTAEKVMDMIFKENASLPVITGERPNVWLYIHGPSHHWAITASREASGLLTAAEKFSTINCLLENDFTLYPSEQLSTAWESHIYPDHGWGGKNGHITDQLFLQKEEFARNEGQRLLNLALKNITGKVKSSQKKGIPVVVFNSMSWKRDDPVTVKLSYENDSIFDIQVNDPKGNAIPSELSNTVKYDNGSIKTAELSFIAQDVASIGYKTFYIKELNKPAPKEKPEKTGKVKNFENDFYIITFTEGGIKQIFDKQLNVDLFQTEKFLAGELFTMQSEGNGAGEFAEVQQPTMEEFDKISNYKPVWEKISDGPVRTVFELKQKLKHCDYIQTVTVYKKIKRIDIDADIKNWDGTRYREFRLAFPINVNKTNQKVTYEVPFGKVTVGEDEIPGAAGERYIQHASDVRPREVQDWISVSGSKFGFTMSSSVAVYDYVDPTENCVNYPVIQPILLTSRRSCHGEGNWYLQEGDHHFSFSIFSHRPGWQNGYFQAKQSNNPLLPVVKNVSSNDATLPENFSFFSVSEKNVLVSTVKKCEEKNAVVVRLYEMEGKETEVDLNLHAPFKRIEKVNLIEEEGKQIKTETKGIHFNIDHNSIETFKIFYK